MLGFRVSISLMNFFLACQTTDILPGLEEEGLRQLYPTGSDVGKLLLLASLSTFYAAKARIGAFKSLKRRRRIEFISLESMWRSFLVLNCKRGLEICDDRKL